MEQLLVIEDLMQRWRCSKRTIADRTRRYSKPRLKFVRLTNKQYFRPEDVIAYENLHLLNASKNDRPATS
jgi:hypothetical protein